MQILVPTHLKPLQVGAGFFAVLCCSRLHPKLQQDVLADLELPLPIQVSLDLGEYNLLNIGAQCKNV